MFEIALVSFISVASIGPTHMLAIREGLKRGFWPLSGVLFGGVIVDILYANLALLGFAKFGSYDMFRLVVLPIGVLIFLFLAYAQIKAFLSPSKISAKSKQIIISPLLTGVLMTLPNPFAIIIWATLFSSVNIQESFFVITLTILVIGVLWILFEGVLVSVFRKYVKNYFLKGIEVLTAVLLIYFSIKFSYEFIIAIT